MEIFKKMIMSVLILSCTSFMIFGMELLDKNQAEEKNSLLGMPEEELIQIAIQSLSDLDVNEYDGLVEAVKRLCKLRAVCTQFRNFFTSQKIAHILLKKGLVANNPQILHEAIRNGYEWVVKVLMQAVYDEQRFDFLMATDESYLSKLNLNEKRGLDAIKMTLDPHDGSLTALHYAAAYNCPEIAIDLLNSISAEQRIDLILAHDAEKFTALHHAVMHNNIEIAKIILDATPYERRVNVVTARGQSDDTPLHCAIGHTEIVKLLIDSVPEEFRSAIAMLTNRFNATILHKAAMFGRTEVAKIILDLVPKAYKADFIMAVDLDGATALHYAAIFDAAEIAKMLISIIPQEHRAAFIMTVDRYKKTVLHYAAQNGQEDIINVILESIPEKQAIAFVTANGPDGKTALHYAANRGCHHTSGVKVAKILVAYYKHKQIEKEIPENLKMLLRQIGAWNS